MYIKKEKTTGDKLVINSLSNKLQKNKELFGSKNKKTLNLIFHKRMSRIEIDASRPFLKRNLDKNLKLKKENNKENNFMTENLNGINKANISKKKLNYKSLDKKEKRQTYINKTNNVLSKFKNIKNIVIEEIAKNQKEEEEEKGQTKKEAIENQIKNNIRKEEKNKEKNKENSNSKREDTLLLKLNDVNSSASSSPSKKIRHISITSNDITDNSSDSNNIFEIKGEFLSNNKKTNFSNGVKKCLFNQDINKDIDNENIDLKKLNKINLKENLSINEVLQTENNININSSFITKPGLDGKKEKMNQDSFLSLEKLFENKLNIFGIFDGHGKNGHLISSLVSKFLSQYLINKENYTIKENNDSDSDSSFISSEEINISNELLTKLLTKDDYFIKKIISELDMKTNECNFDLHFSGTTCLLLFILNNYLICSNIGDSECVLFNCSDEDRWTHEVISKIHKPDIQSEKERILSNGGVIHPYYDEYGVFEGPNRVYVKGKTYPGLSLTRTIGDLEGEKIGIISEPEITIKKLDSTCKYIVMGSDGLWDVIKPYDVRRIVTPFFIRKDPKGACQALLKIASKNWNKEGCDRDDITIIIIFIGTPNHSN